MPRDRGAHVGFADRCDFLEAGLVQLVATDFFRRAGGVRLRAHDGIEERPREDRADVPVRDIGQPTVVGVGDAGGRGRTACACGERRRQRNVGPRFGANRPGLILLRVKGGNGPEDARVACSGVRNRLVERRKIEGRRGGADDVQRGIDDPDGGGVDGAREVNAPARLDSSCVEAGEIGVRASELDRRAHPRIDA